MPLWGDTVRSIERERKAEERARAIRARQVRAANRKHMIEHPVRHGLSRLFGR